ADVELTLPNNLYSGGVNGRVIVTGTALQPELGGQIELSNGDIDVGTRNAANADSPDAPSDRSGWQLALNDLTLSLGKAIRVKQGLLFSFTAAGDLDIGGTPDDLQPEGTIRLERGRLNLGAASFRLDRSFDNTAVFSPDAGLDPLLNVRVFTQATEVSSAPNSPTVFDDNPSEFGGQQNIRIQATVSGRASELNNSTATSNIVELTSSPARTEEEIFALLGANALGNIGDATLTGFALAALQFSIQDSLGDFFGLDELRINSFANPDGSDFGLGLEAAKDLGRDLSVSLQRTFTDPDEDTRYNLRYRINDSLLLRSGTDFQGDSQGSIEYETRF
ncbi:MAG: translocation/assembly module TamB domain-containing protein, partial [Cyanobacteria bacterium P01_F01_bin.33]